MHIRSPVRLDESGIFLPLIVFTPLPLITYRLDSQHDTYFRVGVFPYPKIFIQLNTRLLSVPWSGLDKQITQYANIQAIMRLRVGKISDPNQFNSLLITMLRDRCYFLCGSCLLFIELICRNFRICVYDAVVFSFRILASCIFASFFIVITALASWMSIDLRHAMISR